MNVTGIKPMDANRIPRIISQYEAGAITERSACLEVLMAAGEGDAEAVFSDLPPSLREAVTRVIGDVNPNEPRLLQSYCGTEWSGEDAANLRHREEILHRGVACLQRLTAGRTGGG